MQHEANSWLLGISPSVIAFSVINISSFFVVGDNAELSGAAFWRPLERRVRPRRGSDAEGQEVAVLIFQDTPSKIYSVTYIGLLFNDSISSLCRLTARANSPALFAGRAQPLFRF